jgi:uncharacterized protein (TIGR00299 family) protein
MGKAAYFDMFSGASGDMILGALIDAGLPVEDLVQALSGLKLTGWKMRATRVSRASVTATQVKVEVTGKQPDRTYTDVVKLVQSSKLKAAVKKRALETFRRLGEAEAKVHGTSLENVHFHEIGSVDSIIDVVGAVAGFDLLGITRFYSSPFPLAEGIVKTGHGSLPLPAPATLELITCSRAPVVAPRHASMAGKELVTPTGAAIITSLAEFEKPEMNVESVGYGTGTMELEGCPNVLRLWIGKVPDTQPHGGLVLLETNIDDMNPQVYDHVMQRLFKAGALDVWLTPIQMKKNRPAVMLSVLSPDGIEVKLTEIILRETSTLGIRVRPVDRHMAGRDIMQFESSLGRVSVKVKRLKGEVIGITPEYDECRRIAATLNMPLRDVYRLVEEEARRSLDT